MDDLTKRLARITGIGFAVGVTICLAILVVCMPISYFMNRYIYHHWIMRLIAGLLAFVTLPVSLIYLLFFAEKVHYFSMFPLIEGSSIFGFEGWFVWLGQLLNTIFGPFMWTYEPGPYASSLRFLLVPAGSDEPTVPEWLFGEAQRIAQIPKEDWKLEHRKLTEWVLRQGTPDSASSVSVAPVSVAPVSAAPAIDAAGDQKQLE